MSVAWGRWVVLAVVFATGAACPSLAAPGKRIALVIGNAAYEHSSPLANSANDADDIAATLSSLGFEVIKSTDLKKAEMDRTLSAFAGSLKGAEIGLFYYAGHGLQVSGHNYLVPVDARLESASALDFEMVRLDTVQRIMENESLTNVLILDACRDNPLSRNLARAMGTRSGSIGKGLAAQESGAGTIISYSTQPGNVALDGLGGRNSPFAAALAKHLPSEGRDLSSILVRVRNDVMAATAKRQVPWEHSALTNELVLARASAATAAVPPKAVAESAKTAPARKVEEDGDADGSDSEAGETERPAAVKPGGGVKTALNDKELADKASSTATHAAAQAPKAAQQLKVPISRLTYGMDGAVRVFVTDKHVSRGICYLQFAESSAPKMEKMEMQGGDYFEFTSGGTAYRATLIAVADEECTLEIALSPKAKTDAKN